MDTLVLDIGYQPLMRISWERAVTLLWEQKIQVLAEYEDWTVRSVTLEIKVPSVVRWLRGPFKRKKGIKFSRANVYARDQGRCQYCGNPVPREELTYDHVNPRKSGGETNWFNIVCACFRCNQKKGGRGPEEANMKLLSTPRKPTSLPDSSRLLITWKPGMPESWRSWIKDQVASVKYWNAELDED